MGYPQGASPLGRKAAQRGRSTARKQAAGATRSVICCFCEAPIEVPAKAMSGSCPHCNKRIVLEHIKIRSYVAVKNYDTCGQITVEKRGQLVATRVNGGSLVVRGRVRADVVVRDRVEVDRSGVLSGSVVAPLLVVKLGGVINGHCQIGPEPDPPPR